MQVEFSRKTDKKTKRAVFTIVAKNYMASALTLRASVEKYHPEVDFYVVLSDRLETKDQIRHIDNKILIANSEVVPEISRMSFIYDVVEFSTSIKPFYIKYFLTDKGYDGVMYLDPDILVLDDLTDIWNEILGHSIVLTPHIVDIMLPSDYYKESHILNRGVFNLGFIGCSNTKECIMFLDWWSNRLTTECIRSDTRFVDQKWADYIPVFVRALYVNVSKQYNISDWNYHERKLKLDGNVYKVQDSDGVWKRIKFFHFSGIGMKAVDKYLNSLRVALDDDSRELLLHLITEYQGLLIKNGIDYWSSSHYSYDFFCNGNPILLIHRRLARSLYVDYNQSFENYFAVGGGSFYDRLRLKKMTEHEELRKSYNAKRSASIGSTSKKRIVNMVQRLASLFIKMKGIRSYERLIVLVRKYSDIDRQRNLIGSDL